MEEQLFIRAFNYGYIIAMYDSQLMEKITRGLKATNEFSRGLIAGKEQHEIEHPDRGLNKLKQIRKKSHDHEKGFERE